MAAKLKEKRRSLRLRLRLPVRYQIRGRSDFNNAICDDLSAGGISFVNNRYIAPSTLMTIEMNVLSRLLNSYGRVAWSSPLPHSDRYRLGIEFLELDPLQRNYLQDYINIQRGKFTERKT